MECIFCPKYHNFAKVTITGQNFGQDRITHEYTSLCIEMKQNSKHIINGKATYGKKYDAYI